VYQTFAINTARYHGKTELLCPVAAIEHSITDTTHDLQSTQPLSVENGVAVSGSGDRTLFYQQDTLSVENFVAVSGNGDQTP
jgi:hypothetical protein